MAKEFKLTVDKIVIAAFVAAFVALVWYHYYDRSKREGMLTDEGEEGWENTIKDKAELDVDAGDYDGKVHTQETSVPKRVYT